MAEQSKRAAAEMEGTEPLAMGRSASGKAGHGLSSVAARHSQWMTGGSRPGACALCSCTATSSSCFNCGHA